MRPIAIKLSLLFVGLIFISTNNSFAQKYFDFGDEIDTSATNFYGRNYHFTWCATFSYPKIYVGSSFLIHFNKERFSTYININKNISNEDITTGYLPKTNSIRQKKVTYDSWNFDIGLASSIKQNFLLYAAVGAIYEKTYIENNPDNPDPNNQENMYYYNLYHDGMALNLEIGIIYISPANISIMGGFDTHNTTPFIGIGYSF